MVIFIPMGFVWVDRHKATGRRAAVFGALALVCGLLALLLFLAARGTGPGGLLPALAAMGFGFVALVLLSWSLQTALVAMLMPPQSAQRHRSNGGRRPSEPVDTIGIRGLLATLTISLFSFGAIAYWLWMGKAINLWRLLNPQDRGLARWLTPDQTPQGFTLQLVLVGMIGVAALLGTIAQYRALSRRGQI
jgi:hypothetical protein